MNKTKETSSKRSEIIYPTRQNHLFTQKSTCTISQFIRIQLLILLGLLVLAAIIIPIVVIVLDTRFNACARSYTDSFIQGVTPTTQCINWRIFTTGLTCASYSKMRIYGSNNPTGITVTDSAKVTALAIGLRYNTSVLLNLNGVNWRVGLCSSGYEISSIGNCNCNSPGYALRPCHSSGDWGGINGLLCSAPSQTLSISFE